MTITVKELIEMLKAFPENKEIHFGGLDFYRLKDRDGHVHVEFNQSVYKDDMGRVSVENHQTNHIQ